MQHNWDDLRVFLALARADSLTQAGQRLRMDPATVGRRISRLEDALGFTLFRRSPQGYELSSEGERLFAETGDLDTRIAQATDLGQTRAGHLSGVVRIGAPDGCANFVLPQVCAAIGDAHPDLELQIVALPRILNLSKREADMAIAVSPPQTGRLVVQKVSEYQLHMVARDELRKSVQPIETVEDLKHQPIVGYIPEMIRSEERRVRKEFIYQC